MSKPQSEDASIFYLPKKYCTSLAESKNSASEYLLLEYNIKVNFLVKKFVYNISQAKDLIIQKIL